MYTTSRIESLDGTALTAYQAGFDTYLKTVIEHDPGAKGTIMFFGRQGGIKRALDIFFMECD